MNPSRLERAVFGFAVLAVLAVSAYALFANLADRAWQTDEPVYRNAARAYFEYGNWSHNLEHPMLGKYAIGASEALLGKDPWATRLPSAIATLLAGGFLALLGCAVGRDAVLDDLLGEEAGAGCANLTDAAARHLRRTGAWAGVAAAATWLLLPHPGPSFDVTRLAYLDATMAAGIAAALWAGWMWGRRFELGWALITGLTAGCAVATKVPAVFLAVPMLLLALFGTSARPLRLRVRLASFGIVAGTTAAVPLITWLPLGRDLPHALRFLVAMQARHVDQHLELAGRTYADAPIWTQAWWQWSDWPAFTIVQIAALVLAWLVLPRRAAAYLVSAVLAPALAYAVGGGRILPHWQVTWQVAMCALVGIVAVRLVTRSATTDAPPRDARRVAGAVAGAAMLALVAVLGAQRADDVRDIGARSVTVGGRAFTPGVRDPELDSYLEVADRPGKLVIDRAGAGIARSLSYAHPYRWDGTYHSAAESQHPWSSRTGGRPLEPALRELAASDVRVGDVTAIVLRAGEGLGGLPIDLDLLKAHFVRHRVGEFVVWLNNDLRAPSGSG